MPKYSKWQLRISAHSLHSPWTDPLAMTLPQAILSRRLVWTFWVSDAHLVSDPGPPSWQSGLRTMKRGRVGRWSLKAAPANPSLRSNCLAWSLATTGKHVQDLSDGPHIPHRERKQGADLVQLRRNLKVKGSWDYFPCHLLYFRFQSLELDRARDRKAILWKPGWSGDQWHQWDLTLLGVLYMRHLLYPYSTAMWVLLSPFSGGGKWNCELK